VSIEEDYIDAREIARETAGQNTRSRCLPDRRPIAAIMPKEGVTSMFDLDLSKILLVAIVALVVVGPKDLPRVLGNAARVYANLRRMSTKLRSQAMDFINEADLKGVESEVNAIGRSATAAFAFDATTAMRGSLPDKRGVKAAAAVAEPSYASAEMREYLAPPSAALEAMPRGQIAAEGLSAFETPGENARVESGSDGIVTSL
jgi:sec-independent protein translocase protein TatB